MIFWISGKVPGFAGIGLKIDERLAALSVVIHAILEPLGADHPSLGNRLKIGGRTALFHVIFDHDVVSPRFYCLAQRQRAQTSSGELMWHRRACEVKHCRQQINAGVHQLVAGAGFGAARKTDDERHARGFFIEHGLLIESVRPGTFTVIAGEDDYRVVFQSGAAKRGEQSADLRIYFFNQPVVAPAQLPPVVRCEIADGEHRTGLIGLAHDGHRVRLVQLGREVGGHGRAQVRRGRFADGTVGQILSARQFTDVVRIHETDDEQKRSLRLLRQEIPKPPPRFECRGSFSSAPVRRPENFYPR